MSFLQQHLVKVPLKTKNSIVMLLFKKKCAKNMSVRRDPVELTSNFRQNSKYCTEQDCLKGMWSKETIKKRYQYVRLAVCVHLSNNK